MFLLQNNAVCALTQSGLTTTYAFVELIVVRFTPGSTPTPLPPSAALAMFIIYLSLLSIRSILYIYSVLLTAPLSFTSPNSLNSLSTPYCSHRWWHLQTHKHQHHHQSYYINQRKGYYKCTHYRTCLLINFSACVLTLFNKHLVAICIASSSRIDLVCLERKYCCVCLSTYAFVRQHERW